MAITGSVLVGSDVSEEEICNLTEGRRSPGAKGVWFSLRKEEPRMVVSLHKQHHHRLN